MKYEQRLKKWKERRQQIVALRMDRWTFQEIGDSFGITRERARQLFNAEVEAERLEKAK